MKIDVAKFGPAFPRIRPNAFTPSCKLRFTKVPSLQFPRPKRSHDRLFQPAWDPLSHPREYRNPVDYENCYLCSLLTGLIPIAIVLLLTLVYLTSGYIKIGDYDNAAKVVLSSIPLLLMLFTLVARERRTRA